MAITPLNQLDIYRIVHDFDRDHFKIAKPLRDDQAGRVIVINQFERMLASFGIPLELIDNIMRRSFQYSPSVGKLLIYYKNTPAIALLHPLPLSTDTSYINTASRSLIVRLKQTPANGELASYQQLMASVFTHHFKKLNLEQKLELIQRSNITPWEQRSTSQKLELLGRIQAPTLLDKAKFGFQLLSCKVQLAAAWALENTKVIRLAVWGSTAAFVIPLAIAQLFPSSIANTAIYQTLQKGWRINICCLIISVLAAVMVCPVMVCLGLALQISILPKSVKETGEWITLVSSDYYLVAPSIICPIDIFEKLKALQQTINTAKITREQNNSANAHLPDLIDQWLQLTTPTDTGSLQLDKQELKRLA